MNLNTTPLPIERIRLAFYATETIPPIECAPGILRSDKKILFSIQNILWDSKGQSLELNQKSDYTFPFTIQMPMVQFPPSIDHGRYRCIFQLIAILDTPKFNTPVIKTVVPVICMPFVETSLLKVPMVMNAQKGGLSARARMGAQEFVPGDIIPISLHVDSIGGSKKKSNSLQYVTVQFKLVQVLSLLEFSDIADQMKTIATTNSKLLLITANDKCGCDGDFTIKIPSDISPSYDYGKLVKISYKLQVSVDQKGPLGGIWSYSVGMEDIKITIGTLGYGIRTSNELKLYSDFEDSTTDKPSDIPLPKFMKNIEYEDALPLYDSSRLPDYEQTPSQTTITF